MKRLYLSPPDVGPADREALLAAFDSGWVAPVGPEVDGFEVDVAEWLQSRSGTVEALRPCVALSSGTAALHLALLLAGVARGDLVFVSSFTFAASVNAVLYCGAEPVFLDSEEKSWNLDPDVLEEALEGAAKQGRLPKALICVDLYGMCADYGRIRPLCDRYGVALIQDSAEALGARYGSRETGSRTSNFKRPTSNIERTGNRELDNRELANRRQGTPEAAGLQGDFGVFSFNGNKILTTSGGGVLVCPDEETAKRARFLATQAREDAPHYEHREVGYNYRMSNLLAALGRSQLQALEGKIAARRQHFEGYQKRMNGHPGLGWIPFGEYGEPNYWLTCLTLDPELAGFSREDLRLALEKENIESRPLWKPMHLQPAFKQYKMWGGSVSEKLFARGLCLPSGSGMTDQDRERVIGVWDRVIQ